MLAVAGCGRGTSVAPPVDADRARGVLREALDAWKGSQSHDSMAQRPSPIRVADEDWLAGARLLSFEISPKDEVIGASLRCPVSLSMKVGNGRESKKQVAYNVTTSPTPPSVIRQD